MNLSVPLGLILAVASIAYAALSEIKNLQVFLSVHAAAIVIGGTLAASLICFPMSQLFGFIIVTIGTITGANKAKRITTINEIINVAISVNDGQPLSGQLDAIKNPFLKESLQLMISGGLDDAELEEVLEKRVEMQNEKYKRDGVTLKTVGKFPPAFGLVGTTMGMIALLQGLGSPDAFDRLGPSMSIALVATFYGLVLANALLIPMGENLTQASEDDLMMRRVVVDGVRLIKEKKHPLLVEEYLKSYLPPNERKKMRKVAA
jgi:chemotaxis protein MotA